MIKLYLGQQWQCFLIIIISLQLLELNMFSNVK